MSGRRGRRSRGAHVSQRPSWRRFRRWFTVARIWGVISVIAVILLVASLLLPGFTHGF